VANLAARPRHVSLLQPSYLEPPGLITAWGALCGARHLSPTGDWQLAEQLTVAEGMGPGRRRKRGAGDALLAGGLRFEPPPEEC
jgi:hypothetical protein